MQYGTAVLALSLVTFVAIEILPAYADDTKAAATRNPSTTAPRTPFRQPRIPTHEFDTRRISDSPGIPGLPPYPGVSKLIGGFSQSRAPGGASYVAQFCTKDSKDVVLNWYGDAFRNNGWTLDRSMKTDNCVAATDKNGASCQILVNDKANQDLITPRSSNSGTAGNTVAGKDPRSTKPSKSIMVWIQYKARS